MPETRYWTVTQEREVQVTGNTPADAIRVAQAAFNDEDHDFRDIGGMVRSKVKETAMDAREGL